jgi:magnesium transporter
MAAPKLAGMPRTRLYRNGVLEAEGFPIAEVSDHLEDPAVTIWFDLCSPTAEDLMTISEELGLHRLAVEDVLQEHQRPKLDIYDSHIFVTVYTARLDSTGALQKDELSLFVTKNALVTVRRSDHLDIDAVVREWDANRDLAKSGVSFLLHGLLDHVVDGHFDLVQLLDDQVERLEDELFLDHSRTRDLQRNAFELRKTMVQFRRITLPMREVINSLIRRDLQVVDAAMVPYYEDVYDHVLRVTEWTESLRDLIGNVRETYLTMQGNRMNDIMKRVTSWAAIIAIPTAITGFYGQNVPYPGFGASVGFWTSLLLMAVASLSLYLAFRKRDWI